METQLPTIERCEQVAGILKNLAHPQRLMILCLLSEKPRSVTELTQTVGISQSAVSQFLTRMKLEGLVVGEREGKSVLYRIDSPEILQLLTHLHDVFCRDNV